MEPAALQGRKRPRHRFHDDLPGPGVLQRWSARNDGRRDDLLRDP